MNDNNHTQFTVSVVMCTYNGEQFLREQMDSILAQDYPLHEIIVQDDRSTDDTWDILQAYAKAHPGMFKLFRNNEQLGFNRNFHTALLRATGQYIAICDQDDIWFPQKIRRQVETIGEADLCFSDYFTDPTYTLPLRNYVAPRTDFEHMLFYDCTPGHTMLLRADLVREIKEWNYHIYYDWWIVMHAQMGRGVVKVCEALNWHRHHAASATTHIFRKGFFEAVPHPTWQPYLLGPLHRLHLQRKRNYRFFYSYLAVHIDQRRQPVPARIARLMLRRCPFAVWELCLLCCRYFDRVYPGQPHGLKGRIRGFFYPFISAYGNDLFKLEK